MKRKAQLIASFLAAGLGVYWLTSKPRQPPGYQQHICNEAVSAVHDVCENESVDPSACEEIVKGVAHRCYGALPEDYAPSAD